jgi:hypothetical protein
VNDGGRGGVIREGKLLLEEIFRFSRGVSNALAANGRGHNYGVAGWFAGAACNESTLIRVRRIALQRIALPRAFGWFFVPPKVRGFFALILDFIF